MLFTYIYVVDKPSAQLIVHLVLLVCFSLVQFVA
jgi:hypothetical protein